MIHDLALLQSCHAKSGRFKGCAEMFVPLSYYGQDALLTKHIGGYRDHNAIWISPAGHGDRCQREQLGLQLLLPPARLQWRKTRHPAACKQSNQSCGLLLDSRGANVMGKAVPQPGWRSASPVEARLVRELCASGTWSEARELPRLQHAVY